MFRFNQDFLKSPDLFYRHPDAAPDPGGLEIPLVQEAVDGPRRDREVDGHLVHPEAALRAKVC